MKIVYGKSYNIQSDILGRVTFGRKNIFSRANEILVTNSSSRNTYNYRAVITSDSKYTDNKKYCITDSINDFKEGDIVLLNSSGEIVFLYESQLNSNALLVTERCNHRCITCPQPPVNYEKCKTNFNLELISLMDKNTIEIGITGGEPTIIGDDLFIIINHIKKRLPKAAISILSNGVRFSDMDYTVKLAKCGHKNLQVDIPLFSDIASAHNNMVGASTFYKTVYGLYNLARLHQKIGIRIVINKQNYKRLPYLSEFIYRNFPFVSQVAFMGMEVIGNAEINFDELWIDSYQYMNELKEAVIMLDNRGLSPCIYNTQLCILPNEIRKYAKRSISEWKNIYIEKCDSCLQKECCAGLFASNRQYHSRYINPISEIYSLLD